jgi:hypothetical protein
VPFITLKPLSSWKIAFVPPPRSSRASMPQWLPVTSPLPACHALLPFWLFVYDRPASITLYSVTVFWACALHA